jgi:hypothetical protein
MFLRSGTVLDSSVRLKFEKVFVVWRMRLISSGEKDRPECRKKCRVGKNLRQEPEVSPNRDGTEERELIVFCRSHNCANAIRFFSQWKRRREVLLRQSLPLLGLLPV